MQIKPLSDRVLILIDDEPSVTPGGIVLPERRADRKLSEAATGRVLAVGPGRRDERGEFVPMSVTVGDRVVFELYAAGNHVPTTLGQLGREKLALIRDGEILGVDDDAVLSGEPAEAALRAAIDAVGDSVGLPRDASIPIRYNPNDPDDAPGFGTP